MIDNVLSLAKRLIKFAFNSEYRFLILGSKGFYKSMNDADYIRKEFQIKMKRELDLANPRTFNEKLQWLKLHDRNPAYTAMVDKYDAKEVISKAIGQEYTIPTLGVWNRFDDINFDRLPNQFVLKCTHDSGGLVICTDKNNFNLTKAKSKINKCLKRDYYQAHREWPYKDVRPRIIAEPYLIDESGYELKDYKIFCFNGNPEYIEVDFNRFVDHKLNTYDFEWNPLNFCDTSKSDYSANIKKPEDLEKMREIAKVLSFGIKFLRVDFYYVNNKVFVGELTFYPGSGFIQYDPPEMDVFYGQKLILDI